MTWPLVNPASGYRTLSRLDSLSCRPSISTSTEAAAAALTASLVFLLHRRQARLQGGHQVDHLGWLLARLLHHDLLARRLLLDEGEDPLSVIVLVLRGVEVGREGVGELAGHLLLPVGHV